MKSAAIILIYILIFSSAMAMAETEIGFSGQLAWTNHSSLNDPAGFSFFARQSFSDKLSLQFQYGYFSESMTFHATVYPAVPPPPDIEPIEDDFNSKAWAHTFELALIYNPISYKLLDLYIGGGLITTSAEADIVGIESGFRFLGGHKDKMGFSILADVSLQYSYSLPLVFHLGFRRETTNEEPTCCDCYSIFDDSLNFIELRFGISYRFWPYSRR
jgi:hypothetical protein